MGKESYLSRQYLSCVPMQCFLWDAESDIVQCNSDTVVMQQMKMLDGSQWSEKDQNRVLSQTVCHPRALKYPPSTSYQKFFLKELINKIESSGESCNEKLYTLYIDTLHRDNGLPCFKSYYLPKQEELITIQENSNIISGGTTGLVTWKGGLFLAEWCLFNPEILSDLTILELGCGSGITGLVVAKSIPVKSFVFTDVHHEVLKQVDINIGINSLDGEKFYSKRLDWVETNDSVQCDVIFAADVVFDPTLIPPLVATLYNLLSTQEGAVAYISSTVRNKTTYSHFLSELSTRNLSWKEQDVESVEKIFFFDRNTDIRLLKVYKAR